ncbi:MAG: hypothetical protein UU51_C0035G0005 [Microgenomates group bacterium GW2011_GWC1_41_20]|nr:MAG: hypothetical protein UU51_C0035G0005 [Microgenomates group bacterium GW2011_GWC1_41_20]
MIVLAILFLAIGYVFGVKLCDELYRDMEGK